MGELIKDGDGEKLQGDGEGGGKCCRAAGG